MQYLKALSPQEIKDYLFSMAREHQPIVVEYLKGLSLNSYGFTYYRTIVLDGIEFVYLQSISPETKETVNIGLTKCTAN